MAATNFTPISLYHSATASAVPLAANLVAGELALNTNDGKLYYKNSSNVVTLLAGATSGPAGGSNTQVQFNSSGVLAGSANLTFNGTILTAAGFSGPINGTVGATTASTGAFTTLSATGVTTVQAGTAALPAITTTGDTNTGIFFPVADTIAFSEGGAEAMRIDSSGNVGIGTSSPSALLYVQSASTNALVINEILRNPNSGTGIAAIGFNVAAGSEGDFTQAGIGLLRGVVNGSGSLCFYNKGSGTASNFTTADEKMRIDSSGNVGIGTNSIAANYKVSVNGTGNFYSSVAGLGRIFFGDPTDSNGYIGIYRSTAGPSNSATAGNALNFASIDGYTFSTGGVAFGSQTERMRIDSGGNVLVAQTSQTGTEKFGVTQSATGSSAARFYASSASYVNNIVEISCARSGASTEYNAFCVFDNNTTLQMLIRPNGNLLNANNSYGSLSDVSLKENIVDATPKLDSLMQVKVRNYNLKEDVNKTKQIGVIAQELETVFPGMIETDGDGIKAVKYSVFVPMLVKAIQEQQSLITSLTARIAALEST